MTVFENGEIGRMDGRIGMGAAFVDVGPLFHVARLLANGRSLLAAEDCAAVSTEVVLL